MIAQPRLLIYTISAALYCGLLVICGCSDSVMDPTVYSSGDRRPEAWMGHYANAPDTVAVDDTPTSVRAQLDLYTFPACHLYVTFSTDDPDNWAVFHSDNCLYRLERGTLVLTLKMRVHYPGGTDLIDTSATFEPVDGYWSAVIWKSIGIRLDKDMHAAG